MRPPAVQLPAPSRPSRPGAGAASARLSAALAWRAPCPGRARAHALAGVGTRAPGKPLHWGSQVLGTRPRAPPTHTCLRRGVRVSGLSQQAGRLSPGTPRSKPPGGLPGTRSNPYISGAAGVGSASDTSVSCPPSSPSHRPGTRKTQGAEGEQEVLGRRRHGAQTGTSAPRSSVFTLSPRQ